jgi:hypothetical protein
MVWLIVAGVLAVLFLMAEVLMLAVARREQAWKEMK